MSVTSYKDEGFYIDLLSDAMTHPDYVEEVIETYMAIFNETGDDEWNESWTPEQVRSKLFAYPQKEAECCYLTTYRTGGRIAGLSLVAEVRLDRLTGKDLPPGLDGDRNLAAVRLAVEWVSGGNPLMAVFRELGIRKEHRGGLPPVLGLITTPMRAALDAEATFGCFWTSRKSRLYPLMVGYGIQDLHLFHDPLDQVFMGDHLAPAFRRFCQPPELATRMFADRLRMHSLKTTP